MPVSRPLPEISQEYLNHAVQSFLPADQLDLFLKSCQQPLRKSIRVNTLKTNRDVLKARLNKAGWQLTSIPWCENGFWVEYTLDDNEPSLGNHPDHLSGLFYIQEASSMLPPIALLAHSSQLKPSVFDMAAAPGSKTTQLAAMLNNQGLILANELSASRVKSLHANLVRMGVSNVSLSQFDGRKFGERLSGMMDFVLLDAPCGGEGTVRKDPKALQDWQLNKVTEIADLQKQLILNAYQCLKPGGRMVYSTCTLSKEENHYVCDYLCELTDAKIEPLNDLFENADKAITKEGFLHVLPHIYDSEGFFVAAFSKPDTSSCKTYQPIVKFPFKAIDPNIKKRMVDYYQNHFGLSMNVLDGELYQRDKEIWLFPRNIEMIASRVRLNRSGLKIAEIYPNKIRTTYEFIMAYSKKSTKQKVDLSESQAANYYKGNTIEIEESGGLSKGEVILCFTDQVIGLGNLTKGKIKNQLPRSLVMDQVTLS